MHPKKIEGSKMAGKHHVFDMRKSQEFKFYGVAYRTIPGWSRFAVSAGGKFIRRSTFFDRWETKTPHLNGDRYHSCSLSRIGKGGSRIVLLHRMVAMLWIDEPAGGRMVRHLNDNKDDNRVGNLAYGSHKQNSDDAVRNGCISTRAINRRRNAFFGCKYTVA